MFQLARSLIENGTLAARAGRLVIDRDRAVEERPSLERLALAIQQHACQDFIDVRSIQEHAVMDQDLETELLYIVRQFRTNVIIATARTKEMLRFAIRPFRRKLSRLGLEDRVLFFYEHGVWGENAHRESNARHFTVTLYRRDDAEEVRKVLTAIRQRVARMLVDAQDRLDLKTYELDIVLKSDAGERQRPVIEQAVRELLDGNRLDLEVVTYRGHVVVKPATLHKGLVVDHLVRDQGLNPQSLLVIGDAEPDRPMVAYPGIKGFLLGSGGHGLASGEIPSANLLRAANNTTMVKQILATYQYGAGPIGTSDNSRWDDRFVTEHIYDALSDLAPGEMSEVTSQLWLAAAEDPSNEMLQILASLEQHGLAPATLHSVIRVLIGLQVDPTNPWTSTYVLSDVLGYISIPLIGEDLSSFKKVVRYTKRDSSIQPTERDFIIPAGGSVLTGLKREYQQMRRRHRERIVSDEPALRVAQDVSREANSFLERALRQFIPSLFAELGVERDADALVYFADMKTFASDFDFLYRGPEPDTVRRRILDFVSWLGIKIDPFATLFLEDSLRAHAVDEYVYHSFNFKGVSIAFGGSSFPSFHQMHVEGFTDLAAMWRRVYPYMCNQLAIWNGKPVAPSFRLTKHNIKKLYFRALFNLLFGLCVKFNVSFVLPEQKFIAQLEQYLPPDDIHTLLRGLELVNQLRNVLQVLTRRRWEGDLTPVLSQAVAARLRAQGVDDLDAALCELGVRLDGIRQRYFGDPRPWTDEAIHIHAGDAAMRRWRRVGDMLRSTVDASFHPDHTPSRSVPALGLSVRSVPFPIMVDWFPILSCSLDCAHCWSMGTVFDPSMTSALSHEQIVRMIDILYDNGVRMITITGGEPFLWPAIERIMQYTRDKGIKNHLYTHGLHCVDRHTGEIIGPAEVKLRAVLDRTDFLSVSLDLYHEQSFAAKLPSLAAKRSYTEIVSEIMRYAARYKPTLDLQVISVIGNVRAERWSGWLSEHDIVRYYTTVGDALLAAAHDVPRMRWKFNRYQFNESMRDYQAELGMKRETFDRIVEYIKEQCGSLLMPQTQVTVSHREEFGYLFIRSDGTILTFRRHGEEEVFIELGSFMTGSFRHPEIWNHIPSGVIRQAISVERRDMLAEALRYEAGITVHTPTDEARRRLCDLKLLISEALVSGRIPTQLRQSSLINPACLDVIAEINCS